MSSAGAGLYSSLDSGFCGLALAFIFVFPWKVKLMKCTEVIRLHLDEELKVLIEELADREERAVSEWIRYRLRGLIYGLAHEASLSRGKARVKRR
jgi:hypothetical protein